MSDTDMLVGDRALIRDKAVDRLRSAILSGRYRPGTRLIERELCDLMGVSRTSVREALRTLQSERLITVRPRSGPEVAAIGVKEAKDIYEMRTLLEGAAARLFVERASDREVAELSRLSTAFGAAVAKSDMARMIKIMAEFYECLFAGVRNEAMSDYSRQLHARVNFLRMTSMSKSGRSPNSVREIADIVAAIARRDADAAERAAADHVRNAAASAISMLDNADAARGAAD
jgi:DNA-binding GntR family transcriptional regulator